MTGRHWGFIVGGMMAALFVAGLIGFNFGRSSALHTHDQVVSRDQSHAASPAQPEVTDDLVNPLVITTVEEPTGQWAIVVRFYPSPNTDPRRVVIEYHGENTAGKWLGGQPLSGTMPRFWRKDGYAIFTSQESPNFTTNSLGRIVVSKIAIIDETGMHSYSGAGVKDVLKITDQVAFDVTVESLSNSPKNLFISPPVIVPQDHLADPRGYR